MKSYRWPVNIMDNVLLYFTKTCVFTALSNGVWDRPTENILQCSNGAKIIVIFNENESSFHEL